MSMLRAVVWGMVDLKVIPLDEAVSIKRTIRKELEQHGLWIGGANHYDRVNYGQMGGELHALTQFKVGSRTQPKLCIGSFEDCCRAALQIIES
jgi:hypothetical protein